MLNPTGRAGTAVITPLLRGGDVSAAASNLAALNRCIETAKRFAGAVTIQIPAGVFYLGNASEPLFALDERAAGLTLQGMGSGKTVLIPSAESDQIQISMLSSRVAYYSVGTPNSGTVSITGVTDLEDAGYQQDDVIYVWHENSGVERSPSQRLTIDDFSGSTTILVNETIEVFDSPVRMKHVKGVGLEGPIAAGSSQVALLNSGLASRLSVGDDVLIGDGPALNNFYSEWAKIKSISGANVALDRRIRRDYGTTIGEMTLLPCIVPGPHMADIVIRGLSIASAEEVDAQAGFGTIRFGVRIRLDDVQFIPRPGSNISYLVMNVVNCGNTVLEKIGGTATLNCAATQDTEVRGSLLPSILGREFCSDLLFEGITTHGPDGFQMTSTNGPGPCERIHLVNSRITNHGDGSSASNVNFVAGSFISNVQIVLPNHSGTPPTIELEDDRIMLSNVTSDSAISVSGDDLRIENLTSPNGLTLASGSTGVLVTPLLPTTATLTYSSGHAWRTPLPMRTDRKVVSTGTGAPTLQVMSLASQTADLQQWQNSSGTPVSVVDSAGNVGINITDPAYTLEVGGNFRVGYYGNTGLFLTYTGGYNNRITLTATTANPHIVMNAYGGSTTVAEWNVGIGVTDPAANLHVVAGNAATPAVTIKAIGSMTAKLQQWQNSSGTTKFAIRSDGNLATANAADLALNDIVLAFAIYDPEDNLLGYVPIYDLEA